MTREVTVYGSLRTTRTWYMSTQRHRQQRALVCKRKIKVRNEIKGKNPDQKGKNNEQDTIRFYESNKRMAKSPRRYAAQIVSDNSL